MMSRLLLPIFLVSLIGGFANAGAISVAVAIETEEVVEESVIENLLKEFCVVKDAESEHVDESPSSNLAGTSTLSNVVTSSSSASPSFDSSLELTLPVVEFTRLANHALPADPELDGLLKPPQAEL